MERGATAHHEAGHAVVAMRMGLKFKRVTILASPEEGSLGYVLGASEPLWFRPDVELTRRVQKRIKRKIIAGFAGQHAEAKFRGRNPRWGMDSDNQAAVDLAFYVCSPVTVNAYLRDCWHTSRDVVSESWCDIQTVATSLLVSETLNQNEVIKLITSGRSALRARGAKRDERTPGGSPKVRKTPAAQDGR